MHELYYIQYFVDIPGVEKECFGDAYYFSDTKPDDKPITFKTFEELLAYASNPQRRPKCGIEITNHLFSHKPVVVFFGIGFDNYINQRGFKSGTRVSSTCNVCSPKIYGLDFFRKHLSMDDFITFMQEHYGDKAIVV